jgi:hypothetical protein
MISKCTFHKGAAKSLVRGGANTIYYFFLKIEKQSALPLLCYSKKNDFAIQVAQGEPE